MPNYIPYDAYFSSAVGATGAITGNTSIDVFSAVASSTYLIKAANFVNSHATNHTSIEILSASRVIAILNAPANYGACTPLNLPDGAEIEADNNSKIAVRSTVNTVNVTGTLEVVRKRTPGV